MADTDSEFQQVLETLKAEGATEEQVQNFVEEIAKLAASRFITEAAHYFDEADMQAIDSAPTQEESDKEVQTRFQQKSGKDPEAFMQELYASFANKFLEEYRQNKT